MTAAGSATRPGTAPSTILIVEDELMLLDILGQELEDNGYSVLRAATGEDAVQVLHGKRGEIGLLVTDIRLPGSLDGWDVAEEARRLRSDLPVIYVTGYNPQTPREVVGSVFILKPYRPSAIIRAARQLGVT